MALQLDQLFDDRAKDWGFPLAQIATQEVDSKRIQVDDVASFAGQFRELISGRSRKAVDNLNSTLSRKIVAHGMRLSSQTTRSRRRRIL